MWFSFKQKVATLYKDETARRAFATASGRRPKGVDKLKKLKSKDKKGSKRRRKGILSFWK